MAIYTLKFTCKVLTGDKVHTMSVEDNSLEDTWQGVDLGEINGMEKVREVSGYTHDANPYIGEDEDGEEVVKLSVYDYYLDEDGEVQTNHDDWTECEIIEITKKGEGEDYRKDGYIKKVLRVPIHTWYADKYNRNWDCYPFFHGTCQIPRPAETKYDVGDVVVVDNDEETTIGVVLGVIDNVCEELRTDSNGMVNFDQIRHATMEDVKSHDDNSGVLKYLEENV